MLSQEFHFGAQNLLPGPTRILAPILKPFKMITACSKNLNLRYNIPQRQPTGIPYMVHTINFTPFFAIFLLYEMQYIFCFLHIIYFKNIGKVYTTTKYI